MSRTNFLNYGLKIIFTSIVLLIPFEIYSNQDKPVIWIVMSLSIQSIIGFIIWLIIEKTIGKKYRPTPRVQFKYDGYFSELISGFEYCDIYFKRQIDNCYIFETDRLIWFNQRFIVERFKDSLLISCSEFSLKELSNHSLYYLLPAFRDKLSAEDLADIAVKHSDNIARRTTYFININTRKING